MVLDNKLLKPDEIRHFQSGLAAKELLKSNQTSSRYKGSCCSFHFPQRRFELFLYPCGRIKLSHAAECGGRMAVTGFREILITQHGFPCGQGHNLDSNAIILPVSWKCGWRMFSMVGGHPERGQSFLRLLQSVLSKHASRSISHSSGSELVMEPGNLCFK